jgi:hypothetical protein
VISLLPESSSILILELKPTKTFGGIDRPGAEILFSPSDIAVSEEGEIIVSDARANKIFIFDSEGKVIREIGRQGNGPGDLNGPRFIAIEDGTIKVFEARNNRFQYFSKTGEPLKIYPCKFDVGTGMLTFGPQDDVFVATTGFRTEDLIHHYLVNGQILDPIGKIEGKPFQFYEMLEIREALIKKDLPDVCRNDLFLVVAPQGRIYAISQALPLMRIYSPRGELEKIVSLNLQEFEKIKERCSQTNTELKKKGMPAFQSLSFWKDGVLMENGDLILLLSAPERMTLFRFDKEGRLLKRYNGVQDNIGMMAASRSYLWALGQETHTFYKFRID